MERKVRIRYFLGIVIFVLAMSIGYGALGNTIEINAQGTLNAIDGFLYEYNSSTDSVVITGYIGTSDNIIIPTELADYNVTKINSFALDEKNFHSVVLPQNLREIESDAFLGNYLSEIIIPENVEKINDLAFDNNDLEIISFKGDIPIFGENVFKRNYNLNNVCIPDTADENAWRNALISAGVNSSVNIIKGRNGACREIGTGALGNIELLSCGTNAYQSGDKCVCRDQYTGDPYSLCSMPLDFTCYDLNYSFNNDYNELLNYNCTNTDLVIPNVVDKIYTGTISSDAFSEKGITSLTLNKDLKNIEDNAFKYNDIKIVTFPSKLENIGADAFYGNNLRGLIFEGDTPPNISPSAFSENPALTKICVPPGTTNAYKQALSFLKEVIYFEDPTKCETTDHDFIVGGIDFTCKKTVWGSVPNATFQFECTVTNVSGGPLNNWAIDWTVPSSLKYQSGWPARFEVENGNIKIRNGTDLILQNGESTSFTVIVNNSVDTNLDKTNAVGGYNPVQIIIPEAIREDITATISVTNHWSNFYQCDIEVFNESDTDISNWMVFLKFPTGTIMNYSWSAYYDPTDDGFVLTPIWNGSIPKNKSTKFQIQVEYSGSNFNPSVVSVRGGKK